MIDSAVYVVQICNGRGGVRALARAAMSESTEEFTSADALWHFLVGAHATPTPAGDQPTSGQPSAP